MEDEKNHISSGSHSINLGAGSSVENSNLHIGDVHNHGHSNAKPVAVIDRVHSKPLTILGAPIKAGWLIVSGVVGFIGSVASIVGLSQHLSFWFVLLLSLAGFCLIVGIALIRHRFIRVPYLPFNFEADRAFKLHSDRFVEWDKEVDSVTLSPKGAKYVEEVLLAAQPIIPPDLAHKAAQGR